MTAASFDRDRFRELLVYIAWRCGDDDRFGDVHLNKALFFSDAFALQYLGDSITNARYQKQPKGPTARPLLPIRREMEAEGILDVRMSGSRRVTKALREPDRSLFSSDQLALVDEVISLLRGKTARIVSEESHLNSPGWNLVEVGEDIPLETQLISRRPVDETVLARGRELAAHFGW